MEDVERIRVPREMQLSVLAETGTLGDDPMLPPSSHSCGTIRSQGRDGRASCSVLTSAVKLQGDLKCVCQGQPAKGGSEGGANRPGPRSFC